MRVSQEREHSCNLNEEAAATIDREPMLLVERVARLQCPAARSCILFQLSGVVK